MTDHAFPHVRRRALAGAVTALALAAAQAPAAPDPAPMQTAPAPPPAQTVPAPAQAAPVPAQTAPAPTPSAPPAVGRVVGATVSVTPSAGGTGVPRRARAHPARRLARAAGADPAVTIRDFSFGPSAVTIRAGDTITWMNDGPTAHTATGSGFDTGILRAGQRPSHTFAAAGTFSYHCTLHPFMKGTITVVAASSGSGGGGSGAGGGTSGSTGSASTPATGAATSAPGAATAATPATSAQALPNTGLDAWQVAGLGALSLLCGLALRRATQPRTARTSRAPRGF